MTTKDQERKALAQIKKIIAGLGEESYIGRAFEGCIEMAQNNIENDWWDSMKSTIEMKEDAIRSLKKQLEDQAVEKGAEVKTLLKQVKVYKEDRDALNERIEKIIESKKAANEAAIKNWNMFREQEDKVEALELEVIKLKARLFDLLDK